jgi:hypothetical protein
MIYLFTENIEVYEKPTLAALREAIIFFQIFLEIQYDDLESQNPVEVFYLDL